MRNPVNWKDELYFIRLLALYLLVMMGVYTLLRAGFWVFNSSLFSVDNAGQALGVFWHGLRFDLVALCYINSPLILLLLLPFPFRSKTWYHKITRGLYYLLNIPFLIFSFIDIEYFPYSFKRTTFEATGMTGDFFQLLPQFLSDFWYMLVIGIVVIAGIVWIIKKVVPASISRQPKTPIQAGLFFFGIALTIVALRGGLQNRPLTPIDAARYTSIELIPVVTNTPFNLLHSLEKERIEVPNYFDSEKLDEFLTIHKPIEYITDPILPQDTGRPDNVMVIILESFSKIYMGLYGAETSATPFLDSLGRHALVFDRAFANGTRSVDGIPAICASIPNLMDRYYMNSSFQDNRLDGLGSLLAKNGYKTMFFHGGNAGSFQFESFAKLAGFDQFLDRSDYDNDTDYDGNWGIFDQPFFQFTANTLSQSEKPFGAVLFSVSSHHPFTLPPGYDQKVQHLKEPILKVIHYTDDALRKFFSQIKKESWFRKTLFIILPDHHGPGLPGADNNLIDRFGMPLIVYKPGADPDRPKHVVEQIDILPGIMDYLNLNTPYNSFGTSFFRNNSPRYAIRYIHDIYQINDDQWLLQFDGIKTIGLYQFNNDSGLSIDLKDQHPEVVNRLESYLQAFLQAYFSALVNNTLAYR